jgi:hypothetical protein
MTGKLVECSGNVILGSDESILESMCRSMLEPMLESANVLDERKMVEERIWVVDGMGAGRGAGTVQALNPNRHRTWTEFTITCPFCGILHQSLAHFGSTLGIDAKSPIRSPFVPVVIQLH